MNIIKQKQTHRYREQGQFLPRSSGEFMISLKAREVWADILHKGIFISQKQVLWMASGGDARSIDFGHVGGSQGHKVAHILDPGLPGRICLC